MKNKKVIVVISILIVPIILIIFSSFKLNTTWKTLDEKVRVEVSKKYGINDFELKKVRRSIYGKNYYKIIKNNMIIRSCCICYIYPRDPPSRYRCIHFTF